MVRRGNYGGHWGGDFSFDTELCVGTTYVAAQYSEMRLENRIVDGFAGG